MKNFDSQSIKELNEPMRPTTAEDLADPGIGDVYESYNKYMANEGRSDSEANLMEASIDQALTDYAKTADKTTRIGLRMKRYSTGWGYEQKRDYLKKFEDQINKAKKDNPHLQSYTDIIKKNADIVGPEREKAMQDFSNARGFANLGMVGATARQVMTDPMVLYTLPLGGSATGGTLMANAWKAFKIEAGIALASETAIQKKVYDWKKDLNSPYSVEEAALNVVTAMVGAGVIRAGGSMAVDAVQLRSAAKIKRAEGGKTAETEADILERHADDIEQSGGNFNGHADALDQTISDLENGVTSSVSKVDEDILRVTPVESRAYDTIRETEVAPEFKRGSPVSIADMPATIKKQAETDFKVVQMERSLDDIYKLAQKNQTILSQASDRIANDIGGDNVAFISPGVKGKERAIEKLDKYDKPGEMTDIMRGGFVVNTPEAAEQILKQVSKKFEVLDEGWNVTPGGYADRKLLVRFKDGSVGEVQLWEPHMLIAKEGRKVLKDIPKKLIDKDQKIPAKGKTGHDLYEKQRSLETNNVVEAKDRAEWDRLNNEMNELYSDASKLANRDWKTLIDMRRPDSKISEGEADIQPASADLSTKPRKEPSAGSETTAGRLSQSNQDLTSDDLKGVSIGESIARSDKINQDKYFDKPVSPEVAAREAALDREIYNQDLDIPVGETVVDGKIVPEIKGTKEIYDDIDAQANALKELEGCLLG